MMIKTGLAALVFLSLAWTSLAQAEGEYYFKRGYAFESINVGGKPLRTRPKICKNDQCRIVDDLHRPYTPLMSEYGINRFNYEQLAKIALENEEGETIKLPPDIGQLIYKRAVRHHFQHKNHRGSKDAWIRF